MAMRSASCRVARPSSSNPPREWISASASARRADPDAASPARSASRTRRSSDARRPGPRRRTIAAVPASTTASIEAVVRPARSAAGRSRAAAPRPRRAPSRDRARNSRRRSRTAARPRVVADQPVQPDQQRLVVLVERAHRPSPVPRSRAPVRVAARQPAERRLVQDRLGGGGQAAPLGRAARSRTAPAPRMVMPSSRSAPRPGSSTRPPHAPWISTSRRRARPASAAAHRVAVDVAVGAQRAADLGEAPPQRAQRVVGVGEQQRRELAPGRRPFAQQQVRQQRPALATAELVPLAPRLDPGATEQVNGEHRRQVMGARSLVAPALARASVGRHQAVACEWRAGGRAVRARRDAYECSLTG